MENKLLTSASVDSDRPLPRMENRPRASVSDLGQTRFINGAWYTATATPIKVGNEYETQVRWYLAKWKDVAKAKRIAVNARKAI